MTGGPPDVPEVAVVQIVEGARDPPTSCLIERQQDVEGARDPPTSCLIERQRSCLIERQQDVEGARDPPTVEPEMAELEPACPCAVDD